MEGGCGGGECSEVFIRGGWCRGVSSEEGLVEKQCSVAVVAEVGCITGWGG